MGSSERLNPKQPAETLGLHTGCLCALHDLLAELAQVCELLGRLLLFGLDLLQHLRMARLGLLQLVHNSLELLERLVGLHQKLGAGDAGLQGPNAVLPLRRDAEAAESKLGLSLSHRVGWVKHRITPFPCWSALSGVACDGEGAFISENAWVACQGRPSFPQPAGASDRAIFPGVSAALWVRIHGEGSINPACNGYSSDVSHAAGTAPHQRNRVAFRA